MKKKFMLMCMAGLLVLSVGACGGKNTQEDNTGAATVSEEGTGSGTTQAAQEGSASQAGEGKVSDRADYVGIKDLDIDKYVVLADYKNMQVHAARPVVDDEGIENYINQELLVGNITNRAVQEGDVANIDFVGKKDGVAFGGGTAQGYQLEIGSGSLIAGFEEGLVGVMVGETVDLDLTFPENYPKAELAGQPVVFTVTVNSIQGTAEYAEVTPEQMEQMGLAYRTKEELWEAGKAAAEAQAAEAFAQNTKSAIAEKLVAESTVSNVPGYLVEEDVQNNNSYMESIAKNMYGMDLESFVSTASGMTMEQYNAQLTEMCKSTVEQYLVMEAAARAEGVEVTDEMIQEKAAGEAAEYGYASAEAVIDVLGYSTYRMQIVQDLVLDKLAGIVAVEEETAE